MNLAVKSNIDELSATLARYAQVTKKTPDNVLPKQARELDMELYTEFHKVRPNPADIARATVARGFTTGRKQAGTLAKVDRTGVSVAAMARAKRLLEGAASDYFRVTENDGVPVVKPARVGVRNPDKLLKGGRTGFKFAKSARGLLARYDIDNYYRGLTGDQIGNLRDKHKELRRLNLRALSVAIETGYRARAAKGGTMSLQFLHQVYRKRSSSVVKQGPLVARTRAGQPIGRVDFERNSDGVSAITISGNVPGTAKVDARHGISAKAMGTRVRDMTDYLIRKQLPENAMAAGFK